VRCIKISVDGNNKDFNNLIEKLQNGDQNAFEEMYNLCYKHINFVCLKFCDNKEDAEEVVQDTFVIAFKKASELRGDTLLAYLRKIAANECFRKRKQSNQHQEHIAYSDELSVEDHVELDADFLPEEHLQNKERQAELLRIINHLPQRQREMIYLYYYVDISTEEIARLMHCSANNIYKTLHMARKTIKGKLEGTHKKKSAKTMAFVPLAAALFIEEQVFAATYVNVAGASMVTAVAASAKIYAIAACVVAACTISAAVYFVLQPSTETYMPAYETYTPAYEYIWEIEEVPEQEEPPTPAAEPPEPEEYPTEEPTQEPADDPTPVELAADEATEPETITEPEPVGEPYVPAPVEEPEPYIPQPAEEPTEVPAEEPEALPPPPLPLPPVQDTPPVEQELAQEPEIEEEPTPEPIDRTPEILAALAAATTPADVNGIIRYFGFVFDSQIELSTNMRFRFYVLDDGSGDILIGIAAYEDGSQWRIRFEHFMNGQMPADRTNLFHWMEE